MKNRDEQQEIRSSLNQDVFSKYQFKSQQEEIIKRATEVSKAPKKEKYHYYGLSGVAAILFSIVALSYILASGTDKAPASPPDQEEETDNDQIEDTRHEYIADPDFPLTPHKPDVSLSENDKTETGQTETDHVEKTEEEWKAYFKGLYNEQREEIQKLHLKYESSNSRDTSEVEITAKFDEKSFIVKSNQTHIENGRVVVDHSYISTNNEYIFLDHQNKTFEHQSSSSETAEEWKRDRPLYTGRPLYHLHDMEFNGYSWTVIEQNLKENWVLIELNKTDPQVFLFERGRIKVQYDSGVILEKKKFDGENFVSTFKLKELRNNDELPDLTIDKSIPEHYTDRKEVEAHHERAKFTETLFAQSEEKVLTNNNKIQDMFFSGEDGHLSFVMRMQEGVSSIEGQEAGEKFIEEITAAANASEPFQQKNTTVWAEGQYDFTIRVELPETEFLYGRLEGSEIVWESKAYGEY
ncbi:hypothetical protein FZC78_07450 [Rossellomorea vietnamensis]|uniref:Uncharacterized protein n=1 Tax=Rossellomorea vietnamensis TaxID=218284 RepID=A0A5D4NW76_9BACI|nr:hypothetical protein [Rossellomorea vietnamensis]TYS17688.1 hypothetical protein FZC78_07450 [Rossellomorea vietnamensis]